MHPLDWKKKVLPLLQTLAFQYNGSIVEEKRYSIAWHFRATQNLVSESDKNQILATIRALPHQDFTIYQEDLTLELRTPGIDKGSFAARWMRYRHYDFVIAIGDGSTDEDLFKTLGENCYTVKVGESRSSAARFYLTDQKDVLPFLKQIISFNKDMFRED